MNRSIAGDPLLSCPVAKLNEHKIKLKTKIRFYSYLDNIRFGNWHIMYKFPGKSYDFGWGKGTEYNVPEEFTPLQNQREHIGEIPVAAQANAIHSLLSGGCSKTEAAKKFKVHRNTLAAFVK